jgi:TRAP-type transport system small permease protein
MTFAKINKRSETVLYWSTALATTGFIVFVLVGVITRYLTKTPILSFVELSRLFFVWACFLAAILAYRRKAHIAITFITDKLPA